MSKICSIIAALLGLITFFSFALLPFALIWNKRQQRRTHLQTSPIPADYLPTPKLALVWIVVSSTRVAINQLYIRNGVK